MDLPALIRDVFCHVQRPTVCLAVDELNDALLRTRGPGQVEALSGTPDKGLIAGGRGRGVIFRKGEIIRTVDEPDFLSALIEEGDRIIEEIETGVYTPVSHGAEDFVIPIDAITAE